MPAYVLIRETKKERRAPLRVCIAAVAGLGLGGALLGGTAYGPSARRRAAPLHSLPCSDFGARSRTAPRPKVPTTSFGSKAGPDGHYYVKGSADGVPLEFMIDTGSTRIVLPKETAERLNVGPLNFDLPTYTANGRIQNAQITIRKLTIGPYSGEQTFPRGERRSARYAIAGHELASPLPINRNPKRRYDAPLLRNKSWSM